MKGDLFKMNKPNVTKLMRNLRTGVNKHSPTILMAIGIGSAISATVLAVKATPKALQKIEEAKEEKGEELTKVEVVKAAWKPYIPAAVSTGFSIACIVSSNSVHTRRNAALATCYKITETALTEYREKVVETIGEKKEQTIRDGIAKDKVDKNPVSKSTVIMTDHGNSLMLDPLSMRYFESSIDKIKKASIEINSRMINGMEMYASLNEFYDEIGLDRTLCGDELGWTSGQRMDISFSAQIADDGRPCLVIDYLQPPLYDYRSHY